MENKCEDEWVPLGCLTGITLSVATQEDIVNVSAAHIQTVSEVSGPSLGFPNPSSHCSTCGAKDAKDCEGHFGHIDLPFTTLHPYFLSEVVAILNKICPACKTMRQDPGVKALTNGYSKPTDCVYCLGEYPRMKFKVSSNDLFKKSAITVEVVETTTQSKKKGGLPHDYWDFIPKDPLFEEIQMHPTKRVLSHAQVYYFLKDLDPKFITKFVPKKASIFMNSFPVTPNSHRVEEVIRGFSNERFLSFDERTRNCRKLVNFRGMANEMGSCILESLKKSKLYCEKSTARDLLNPREKNNNDCPSKSSGLRYMKDVVLAKRNDHCFRMTVVGDPNIKLSEIGIPSDVAERLLISEVLNQFNLEKSEARWIKDGKIFVRRDRRLVSVPLTEELLMGEDTIYRPLCDGDIVLINRPPSIHQHSLIALSVKVLPTKSVCSLNPLCCSPFRGDFDGDCLHGYIPQSVDTKCELKSLVSLDKQLFNGQSGKNLISLSQDSLTAAHLMMDDSVVLNSYQMQQLQMFCSPREISPTIVKAPSISSPSWTGKQAFSMVLPKNFSYELPLNDVLIQNGEIISASEESSWLRDIDGNLFFNLAEHSREEVLDIFFSAQGLLSEWLSMRGLSVSLLDLCLNSDSFMRKNLINEVSFGLEEAEQSCVYRQLLNSCPSLVYENPNYEEDQLFHEKQKSAALTQSSVDAFKTVYRDIQSLAYQYSEKENSLMAMFKSGSKGNMLKLAQHSLCVGVQHSLVPLSFSMPRELSCSSWNSHKNGDSPDSYKSYIPYAIVKNSFLSGLNPSESFAHSVTNRDSSFSDNAQLPGTLTRKLMFFMRELYTAYDGTVRNAYGNQLVQFKYTDCEKASQKKRFSSNNSNNDDGGDDEDEEEEEDKGIAGKPVGVLSACALSEAAYSALDQPVSLLETSPLLNLKKALECGSGTKKFGQIVTMSLYLASKLGRQCHGFEYAALEIKNFLEGLKLSDILSTVMIIFTPSDGERRFSPWVCHFHLRKESMKRRRLKVQSVINSLNQRCNEARLGSKIHMPKVQIISEVCSVSDTHKEDDGTHCITFSMAETSTDSSIQLDTVQRSVIPFLLDTVVKGFEEIKRVEILWNDGQKESKSTHGSSGELYLRVCMSTQRGKKRCWDMLKNNCLPIMDLIDWSRSHPDSINELCLAYGIDAAWKYFVKNLESSVSDVGKTILPQHLLLVANSLSVTGEFVALNQKGLSQQRAHASVPSPFSQACFSNPTSCFIKAAKEEVNDGLHGTIDSLAWGKVPPFGTGGQFEILMSGKGHEINKPTDVFALLSKDITGSAKDSAIKNPISGKNNIAVSSGVQLLYKHLSSISKERRKLIKKVLPVKFILNLATNLSKILHQYQINQSLNTNDNSTLMLALYFHPQRDAKIGVGAKFIKVANHPKHENSRCFVLVRTDDTVEDFSYRKCIIAALEIVDPKVAEQYKAKMSF